MSQQHLDYRQIEMGEGGTSSAAPYTSSAKRTSSPSSLCVRSNATVVGEGERLEALARGESLSETRGEPTLRHMT